MIPSLALALVVLAQEAEPESYQLTDAAVVEQALVETMAQPEFTRLRGDEEETTAEQSPDWLVRFLEWLFELLERQGETPDRGGITLPGGGLIPFVVIAAAALLVAFALARSTWFRLRRGEVEATPQRVFQPDAAPGELSPEDYWQRAEEYGSSRRYREAIRAFLLGAMSATERRGQIRYRRGLTNRDYLYAVRGAARESFGGIASAFEHVYFGRRAATPEAFEECRRRYQESFRGETR